MSEERKTQERSRGVMLCSPWGFKGASNMYKYPLKSSSEVIKRPDYSSESLYQSCDQEGKLGLKLATSSLSHIGSGDVGGRNRPWTGGLSIR